jgi:Tfp pilus assembly PilM family ATPase
MKLPIKIPKRKNNLQDTKQEKSKVKDGILGLSLGSYHIGVVLGVKDDENIQIVGTSEGKSEKLDVIQNLGSEEIVNKVNDVIEKSKATAQINVKKIIVGLPAKYLYSKTSTVRIKRSDPDKKVTQDEVDEISKKIISRAQQEIEESLKQQISLELLNSDTTYAKIDGYITKDLQGFRGSTVEISTFMSFVPKDILDNVLNLCKALKLDLITITPSVYAINKLLSKGDHSNYIIVNIGGTNTTTAVVFAGEINIISNFSLGYKSFINYISSVSSVTEQEVTDALENNTISETINKHKNEIVKIWAANLKNTLSFIENVKVYPEQILVYGLGSNVIDNSEITGKINELKFKDTPIVKKINLQEFDKIQDHTKTIKGTSTLDAIGLINFAFGIEQNG